MDTHKNLVPEKLPEQKKMVLAWAQWFGCTGMVWDEKNKVKCYGYVLAYLDGKEWWEDGATINSSPITVLFWYELPEDGPKE